MAFVYLIGSTNDDNFWKIGVTTKKSIDGRLKELQTGNAENLFVKDFFETPKPFMIEKMMHNRFRDKNVLNEWFALTKDDVRDFRKNCQFYQDTIDALKDNDIFNKRKAVRYQD